MNIDNNRISSQDIVRFKELLVDVSQVTIVPHAGPDGDAIGSSLALYQYFKKKGITSRIISPNEYPVFLRWLPKNSEVLDYSLNPDQSKEWLDESDLVVMVDHNSFKRSGDLEDLLRNHISPMVMIDHHPDPQENLDVVFSEVSVSSTCELVYEVIDGMGDLDLLDADIAECLYTGIMTDTGGLSYNSSHPRTYHIMADLLAQGIDKEKIHSNVYNNYSADRMKLLGFCLNEKMEVLEQYHTTIIYLTQDELKKFNYKDGDTEGFVNYPLSISNVNMSVMFMEAADMIKISFRSKGNMPVNLIARNHFNGGGHINAAGGRTHKKMDEALKLLKSVLPKYEDILQ